MGLTISTGGTTLTLAVLTDLSWRDGSSPDVYFLLLVALISLLMVSTIRFPSLSSMFSNRKRALFLLAACASTLLVLPPFGVWFVWTLAYILGVSARSLWRRLRIGGTR